jgi:hypothetical protein
MGNRYKQGALFLALVVFIELALRVGFAFIKGAPLFNPGQLIYHYYPMVKAIESKYREAEAGTYKILILSCSTLHQEWAGDFEKLLEAKLAQLDSGKVSSKPYTVFNAAGMGFSSLDNLNCYQLLSGLKFDLVVFYGGINDARFNNCPPNVFNQDYTHIPWNNEIACLLRHPESRFIITPLVLDYSYQLLKQSFAQDLFIPVHYSTYKQWWDFGKELKSIPSFKRNTESIGARCKDEQAKFLLATFAYHIPDDYALERFEAKELSYSFQKNSREIEVWGRPEAVASFLDSSNNLLAGVAQQTGYRYLDMRDHLRNNDDYYADICHFSPHGLEAFSNCLASEINRIK